MKLYYSETLKISDYEGICLLQDHRGKIHDKPWDDFGYVVTFNVYWVTNSERQILGEMKLLVKGYQDTSEYLKKEGVPTPNAKIFQINGALERGKIVSLPTSISLYKKIRKVFGGNEDKINQYLELVCDASYHYDRKDEYKSWEGFSGSILRDGSKHLSILRNGYQVAIGRYQPSEELTFEIDELGATFEPIEFFFDRKREIAPTNINLLIGKNGVGKTHILKHLSKVITGLEGDLKEWPCFNKLMVMAYSPFENFYTKSDLLEVLESTHKKTKQKVRKVSRKAKLLKINEYAYIGFRNEDKKFDVQWPREHSVKSIISILEYDEENSWWYDESRLKMLFDTLSISIDFDCISLDINDGNQLLLKKNDLIDVTTIKTKISLSAGLTFLKGGNKIELSSGQIIYSYMLPALVSEIEDESLIIIDEPELYLHPTMEVGLIKMLRALLSQTKSYAIIATHSSFLAREIERKAVTILRKENGVTKAYRPTIETYGASLDAISGESFDDYEIVKPFQQSISLLLSKYDGDVTRVINKYSKSLGDDALAYLSSLENKNDNEIELEDS
jgi:energy-coupling factor transporter ATP-binding protein EcfA2